MRTDSYQKARQGSAKISREAQIAFEKMFLEWSFENAESLSAGSAGDQKELASRCREWAVKYLLP